MIISKYFDEILKLNDEIISLREKIYIELLRDFFNKPDDECINLDFAFRSIDYIENKIYPFIEIITVLRVIGDVDLNDKDLTKNAYKYLQHVLHAADLLEISLNERQYIWDKLMPYLLNKEAVIHPISSDSFLNFVQEIDARGVEWIYGRWEGTQGNIVRFVKYDRSDPKKEPKPMVTNNGYKAHCECCKCKNLKGNA